MTRTQATTPEAVHPYPSVAPAVDIFENADEVLLVADLPGVKPEDVSVRVEKEQLFIEGVRRGPEPSGATRLATEYRPLGYQRAFLLPRGIDASRLDAQLHQGVLTLHLPKSDAVRPRQIQVKAS